MQSLYAPAIWRPLSDVDPEPIIVPRVLIWHTMVGTLRGTEAYFRRQGYNGVESTFGLGGPWDTGGLDGVLWQWQRLDREADAQYDGNPLATSIECSDGGNPDHPFSDAQIETSIRLGIDWCHLTGVTPAVATDWNGPGFGCHNMFDEWNRSGHSCPNPTRRHQLETIIWPAIIEGGTHWPDPEPPSVEIPRFPLPSGWYFGPKSGPAHSISGYYSHQADLQRWQQQMRYRGWAEMIADGLYGPITAKVTKQFQSEKRLTVDGLIGAVTWTAAWKLKVT